MANKKGDEYKLSLRERKFVAYYLESGDATDAVKKAKFNTTSPAAYARKLLSKPKIQKEVAEQWELFQNDRIASANEIMGFYTLTMRGKVKDQFGLEATLSDRLKAADALSKRQMDAKALAEKGKDNNFTIKLCWDRNNTTLNPDFPVDEDDDILADIPDDDEGEVDGEQ